MAAAQAAKQPWGCVRFNDILPWKISNDYGEHPNQHNNSHKLCNEMEYPILTLTKVNRN